MEGLTLKTWKLGRKLGAGACSDVFEAEPVSPLSGDGAGRHFVVKVSPLVQLPPAKLKNKKRKKTPAERNADALYAEHLLYAGHLRNHAGVPFVPVGAYGEDKGYRFLVMERLGRTLETVLQQHGPIPSATAGRLGFKILETLQHMHVSNILYVDVKPENFMLDTDDESRVYCVDFGISDRYVTAMGKHKEYKEGAVVGTPTFLSVNCHNGATSSRRDDIESLLYVLVYLVRGDLPWQDATSDEEGASMKKQTSVKDLCASLPREWGVMLDNIRSCGFEDRPDYDFFAKQFSALAHGSAKSSGPFDWGSVQRPATAQKRSAKPAAAPRHSATADPEPKRTKSKESAAASKPAKPVKPAKPAKPTKAVASKPTAKAKPNARAARSKATKEDSSSEEEEEEDQVDSDESDEDDDFEPEEPTKSESAAATDPHRRRKAAQRANAAAAAAKAAAKRAANGSGRVYNLRSTS